MKILFQLCIPPQFYIKININKLNLKQLSKKYKRTCLLSSKQVELISFLAENLSDIRCH